jgi:hypothetical protein
MSGESSGWKVGLWVYGQKSLESSRVWAWIKFVEISGVCGRGKCVESSRVCGRGKCVESSRGCEQKEGWVR